MSKAIILAAGIGERMKSEKHKVLHPVMGTPIIDYVLAAAQKAGVERSVVVVGNRAEQVMEYLGERAAYSIQRPENGWGTAKACQAAIDHIGDGPTFVILGDSPLLRAQTLIEMEKALEDGAAAAVMTAVVDDPTGYGRILFDEKGWVCGIVEHKEATEEQLRIREINSAALCCDGKILREALPQIRNDNAKGEYYLTDLIGILYKAGLRVAAVRSPEEDGVGINDRVQLAQANDLMRARINRHHMQNGVSIIDPTRVDIGPDVVIGTDTLVYPGCTLMGNTAIGAGCTLLPGCRLEDSVVGDGTKVENSVLLQSKVGKNTSVGPFAYLRPGTVVGDKCRIGDFVEIKNSSIGDLTHVSHLTYVGDSDLGVDVNLGCGVVFSNYDGKKKYRSTVGDRAFIGGNVNLVSPVNIGKEAYIAAGTTVTEDVPAGALAIGRSKPYVKGGWVAQRAAEGRPVR